MRITRRTVLAALASTGVAAPALRAAPGTPAPSTPATPPDAAPPYTLSDTAVHTLRASKLNRDYELLVGLPPSYGKETRSYPVVFTTDAPYAFPLTRAIAARVTQHSHEIPEFILVGLGYAKGDTPSFSRGRDYTPSPRGSRGAVSDMPGRPPVFGEAEGYRGFIADEVFPFIASRYRVDPTRRVFAGHSYGALLGAHMLLAAPAMFSGYVLGSPSFWYDDHLMLARARAFQDPAHRLHARVYLGVGGYEAPPPRGHAADPRFNRGDDMVGDLRAFARILADQHHPGLAMRCDTIDGEDHLTVGPVLITRGLMFTLGAG